MEEMLRVLLGVGRPGDRSPIPSRNALIRIAEGSTFQLEIEIEIEIDYPISRVRLLAIALWDHQGKRIMSGE